MRRKFLYFKIYDLKEHPKEIEILSSLEITNLVGEVNPIDNIFQLSQQPEVRRIIEKDINLQNALTDTLPRRGRHGYLWVGDDLPDIMNALSRLSYIKEVFLFQQMLEPEPKFVKEKLKNITFLEFNIHLWRVYKFWTFSFFLNRAMYIGTVSKNETEIDEKFRIFRDELNQLPGKIFNQDPAQMISNIQDVPLKNFNLDQRTQADNSADNIWLRALVNAIAKPEDGSIYNPFAQNGNIVMESVLTGYDIYAEDLNPVQVINSLANGGVQSIDLQDFSRRMTEMQSKIKMLMNASSETQTDLFLYSVEGQFLHFWETEKIRMNNIVMSSQLENIKKYIAATRFLIQTKTIAKSDDLNTLFNLALINLIAHANRKRDELEFYEAYQQSIYSIYLKLYVAQKLNAFFSLEYGKTTVQNKSIFDDDVPRPSLNSVITFFPSKISKNGFDKDRLPISLLNLHGAYEKLEHGLVGGKYIKNTEKEKLENEIASHEGFYKTLPKEGNDILAKLELMGRKDEVTRYYLLWKQYVDCLFRFKEYLADNSKLCIILENPIIKAGKTIFTIPTDEIISKYIENNEDLNFKVIQLFTRKNEQLKSGNVTEYKVLICQKN